MGWAASDATRPWGATLIYIAAAVLRAASDVLSRVAARIDEARAVPPVYEVEFHGLYREAGAPEGALYINGELVGWIEGVSKL
ncbi:MAG: hypothetical protein HY854_10495 [Burkholderiales bacterium]|nr:hypothetical protein [Burkholderiales bacterium]